MTKANRPEIGVVAERFPPGRGRSPRRRAAAQRQRHERAGPSFRASFSSAKSASPRARALSFIYLSVYIPSSSCRLRRRRQTPPAPGKLRVGSVGSVGSVGRFLRGRSSLGGGLRNGLPRRPLRPRFYRRGGRGRFMVYTAMLSAFTSSAVASGAMSTAEA